MPQPNPVRELIDRFENDAQHGLTLQQWAAILRRVCAAYAAWPCRRPERFRGRSHRIEVYGRRAARREELFHGGDEEEDADERSGLVDVGEARKEVWGRS